MSHWLTEGRNLGGSLRRFTCLVVAGGNADATADVAMGIAEAQSEHRRVVLGDLLGDARRFAPLRDDDDPHGLVDAFDYGISLARVVRPVAGHDRLQFAPTGSDVPDYAELLRHPRWQRLISAFAESEQLFVIAVPVDATGLEELVYRADGIILVDAMLPGLMDDSQVVGRVALPPAPMVPRLSRPAQPSRPRTPPPSPEPTPAPVEAAAPPPAPEPEPEAEPEPEREKTPARPTFISIPEPEPTREKKPARPTFISIPEPRPATASRPVPAPARPTGVFKAFAKPVGYGAGFSIVGALLIFWLVNRPATVSAPPPDSVAGIVASPEPRPAAPTPVPPPESLDPNVVDPADSSASVYAVQIMAANTEKGAILKLQEHGQSLPASTYAPVEIAGKTWYKVLTGAFTTRGGADSLLVSLRSGGVLDSVSPGIVVRVPYAVRIDSVSKAGTINDLLTNLRNGRKLPVYALEQRNGWVWIMVGAFETRSQADSYMQKVRADGNTAELVLRQGRMF